MTTDPETVQPGALIPSPRAAAEDTEPGPAPVADAREVSEHEVLMPSLVAFVDAPVVDGVVGAGLAAIRAGRRSVGLARSLLGPAAPVARWALRPRPIAERYWPETVLRRLVDEGHVQRVVTVAAATHVVRVLVPRIVDEVLDELDLTQLVLHRVDLDAVVREVDLDGAVERVDVDAVVSRVDLDRIIERLPIDHVLARIDLDEVAAGIDVDAVIDRVDLLGLAQFVIDGVDLPKIIRESTGSMASEGVSTLRMQAVGADERVNRLVDRMLLRRNGRRSQAPRDDSVPPEDAATELAGDLGEPT